MDLALVAIIDTREIIHTLNHSGHASVEREFYAWWLKRLQRLLHGRSSKFYPLSKDQTITAMVYVLSNGTVPFYLAMRFW